MNDQHGPQSEPEPEPEPELEPYETAAPNAYVWTEMVYDALSSGTMSADIERKHDISTATLDGPCPRCDHQVNFSMVLDGVTGERVGTLGDDAVVLGVTAGQWLSISASCRCGEEHPGRPKGIDHGCGINFNIEIQQP